MQKFVNCAIKLQVIPPGMDFSSVAIQEDTTDTDGDLKDIIGTDGASPRSVPPIWAEANTLISF